MSASRTQLDDTEYATRFTRLDGAISNLAFNYRKDWVTIPFWLAPMVNKDAHKVKSKEMTPVGRAYITRWITDEVWDRYFHPSIEPTLSAHLKTIERTIRFQAHITSAEEMENHLAKLAHWRLTTVEGLSEMLSSPQAEEWRKSLISYLVEKLVASLGMHFVDPMPAGVEQSVLSIIELAVGIAANTALESRDIYIQYPLPGTLISETYMKTETSLPPLISPGGLPDDMDSGPEGSNLEANRNSPTAGEESHLSSSAITDNQEMNNTALASAAAVANAASSQAAPPGGPPPTQSQASPRDKKKGSVFGSLMASASAAGRKVSEDSKMRGPPVSAAVPNDEKEARVRLAGFVFVEVRGRPGAANAATGVGSGAGSNSTSAATSPAGGNVLFKAPVWAI